MNKAAPLILLVLLAACEEKPSAKPSPAKPPAAAPAPTAPAASAPSTPATAPATGSADKLTALGLTLPVPGGWKSVPPSNPMRLAELQVPDPAGDAAKACTVAVSTAGGDVESNIARWTGQVKDASGQPAKPNTTTRTVAGMKVHVTEMTGAFAAGMGDPTIRENWMLRGAIVETAGGLLFIKMTGPAEPMAAAGPAFNQMIDGLAKS